MDTLVAYENHLGDRIEFGGGSESLHYLEHGLRSYLWEHEDLNGRVAKMSRGMRELSFPVGIAAPDGATGIELRNRVMAVTEPDAADKEPGRFVIGRWSLPCYVIGCEPTNYWMDDRFAEMHLTVLTETSEWVAETLYHFEPGSASGGITGNGDFPFDFPWEFARPRVAETVSNGGLTRCPFLWRVYGPATDPYVIIGPNTYRVNCDVPVGARLEVDSMAKTITLIDVAGNRENRFADRQLGAKGSGTYIFEPVPPGDNALTRTNDYIMDLVLYDVRSAPGWSE